MTQNIKWLTKGGGEIEGWGIYSLFFLGGGHYLRLMIKDSPKALKGLTS